MRSITLEIRDWTVMGTRGDFAPLISSLNIHEGGRDDERERERQSRVFESRAARLCRICSAHNERKVFFKFHKGSAG